MLSTCSLKSTHANITMFYTPLFCHAEASSVRVLDVGCGANLIYPLLGAAMHGWRFVGVDITDTAVEWAERNAAANPRLQHLLKIRRVQHPPGSDAGTGCAPLHYWQPPQYALCHAPAAQCGCVQ